MKKSIRTVIVVSFVLAASLVQADCTTITYVTPKIGGDQVSGMGMMIMPEICFDGNNVLVLNNSYQPWPVKDWDHVPVLRPLTNPCQQFDPCQPYHVLNGKAYNFQYGWDSGLLNSVQYPYQIPTGTDVWIEVLEQTPGIETYDKDNGYTPIFGTPKADGNSSPLIWKWNRGMRHNVYAEPNDFYGRVSAMYKVYLGNPATGAELINPNTNQLYGSSVVTLRWIRPCPYALQGDINSDCIVNFDDVLLLTAQWLNPCATPDWCDNADIDRASAVDSIDFAKLAANWCTDCLETPRPAACVPR